MNKLRNLSVLMILAMLFGFVGASDVSAASGDIEWVRQFGTSGTEIARVATDASGTYVVGQTDGALPGQTILRWPGRVCNEIRCQWNGTLDPPVRYTGL